MTTAPRGLLAKPPIAKPSRILRWPSLIKKSRPAVINSLKPTQQARKEIVGVHRDLQAERTRLDGGWSSLETERQRIASERRTESLLAPLMSSAGAVAIVAGLLGFCWYALVASRTSGEGNADLDEILVGEILAGDRSLLGPDEPAVPAVTTRR